MLVPALVLAVVTIGTKVLTGYLAARRAGIGEPGRWRAGFALTPRGEFSIVIAGLAVAAGIDRVARGARDRLRADHDRSPGRSSPASPTRSGSARRIGSRPPACATDGLTVGAAGAPRHSCSRIA